MRMQYEYHTLTYKYSCYYHHTDCKLFLVICELIDRLSVSLGGYTDGVDRAIGDRLNKVIVGVNKRSKATCNKPPAIFVSSKNDIQFYQYITVIFVYIFISVVNTV